MKRIDWIRLCAAYVWVGLTSPCLNAQDAGDVRVEVIDARAEKEQAEAQANGEKVQPPAKPATKAPLPGPKYLNLRFDEDFSYLDGP